MASTAGFGTRSNGSSAAHLAQTTRLCRTLRDVVAGLQHLKVNHGRDKPPTLLPVTESPATPSKSAGSSIDATPSSSPASHPGSSMLFQTARRSPLGRSVVTALEAELDQAGFSHRPSKTGNHWRVYKQLVKRACNACKWRILIGDQEVFLLVAEAQPLMHSPVEALRLPSRYHTAFANRWRTHNRGPSSISRLRRHAAIL